MDVRPAPFHDAAQFWPVFDLLKRHLFHRCAGNDQPIEPALLHVLECLIEFQQMFAGRVFGFVAVLAQNVDILVHPRAALRAEALHLRDGLGVRVRVSLCG